MTATIEWRAVPGYSGYFVTADGAAIGTKWSHLS